MRVNPEWLKTPTLHDLFTALTRGNHDAYAVGGCVRDAIVGMPCADIDITTDARPDRVKELLERAGFDMHPTGLDHGTWTASRDNLTYEVTTYRRDVATDGRRATVEFAHTMYDDAERRDFTMNALYMDATGEVYDPTGHGLNDLLACQVVFVGKAEDRCREDFLRILRLFRFHARFGRGPMNIQAWNAASKLRFGLDQVSGERKWDELKKLLMTHSPMEALLEMEATGVLKTVLPEAALLCFPDLMAAERCSNARPNWPRRYFVLAGSEIPFPHANSEARYLDSLHRASGTTFKEAVMTQLWGEQLAQDAWMVRNEEGRFNRKEAYRGFHARLPVTAQDFMSRGVPQGPELGHMLRQARAMWAADDLRTTKYDLLEAVIGA